MSIPQLQSGDLTTVLSAKRRFLNPLVVCSLQIDFDLEAIVLGLKKSKSHPADRHGWNSETVPLRLKDL
jgi:hypothetical protein